MQGLYDDLTPEERVAHIELEALKLVGLAEQLGVSLRIDRVPLQPLAMGHARSVVWAWPERERAKPAPAPSQPARREISDREWAAQPAGLREGCTVHVPGVGDL